MMNGQENSGAVQSLRSLLTKDQLVSAAQRMLARTVATVMQNEGAGGAIVTFRPKKQETKS